VSGAIGSGDRRRRLWCARIGFGGQARILAGATALVALLVSAPAASALDFAPALGPGGTSSGVGTDPRGIAVADFSGDGLADLMTANDGSDDVSYRIGSGGGFAGSANFPFPGADPADVVAGDFDNDGNADAAAALRATDSVAVILAGEGGGFDSPVTIGGAGDEPNAIEVGDFDRDGDQDLVVAGAVSDNVTVFTGDGEGGFIAGAQAGAGEEPGDIATGDWNGDGIIDLALPNPTVDTVSVLIGNGSGGFAAPANVAVAEPVELAAGDLDGDGNRDLVVARRTGANGAATVLDGDGAGGFTAGPSVALPSLPRDVAVADYDGDGDDDAVTANDGGDEVVLLEGDGTGAIAVGASPAVGADPQAIAAADLNSDGDADAVTANLSDDVTSLVGDGSGALGRLAPNSLASNPAENGADTVQVANLNDNTDSNPDVAAAGDSFGDAFVDTFLGGGDGTLGTPTAQLMDSGSGQFQNSVVAADFNEDANQDLLSANSAEDNIALRLGNGVGGFAAATAFAMGDAPDPITTGDFNNDDNLDVATVAINPSPQQVHVRLGNGAGSFAAPQTFTLPVNNNALAAADFDADGDDDLAIYNSFVPGSGTAQAQVFTSDGDGTFTAGTTKDLPESLGAGGDIEAGNLNGGTDPDLVVVQRGGSVSTILASGTGAGFGTPSNFQGAFSHTSVAIADIEGDGDQDLIAGEDSPTVSVYVNDGAASFARESFAAGGGIARDVATGDMNGDGDADLVALSVGVVSGVSVLLQRTPETDAPETRIEQRTPASSADLTPSFSFAANELGSTFECSIDQGTPHFGPCSGPQQMHTGDTLSGGDYTFRVRATDRAGNTDATPATFAFEVLDEIAPRTKITKAKVNRAKGKAVLRFNSNEPGSTFRCKLDRKPFRPCRSPKAYRNLKRGRHTFHVVATDAAGNPDSTPARKRFRTR
jgi:FG-GAP-like repeat